MATLWCEIGKHEWERPSQRGRPPRNCPEHKPEPQEPSQSRSKAATGESSTETTETLTCKNCGSEWLRTKTRGKKPSLCPDCKEKENAEAVPKKPGVKRASTIDEDWEYISKLQEDFHCKCDLRKGMAWNELLALGMGCTYPRYACGVLSRYRERIGWPSFSNKTKEELEIEATE